MADEYGTFREFAMKFWDATGGLHSKLRASLDKIENARIKKDRDAALAEARSILVTSHMEYSRRVLEFNDSIDKSEYFNNRRFFNVTPTGEISDQSHAGTEEETRR